MACLAPWCEESCPRGDSKVLFFRVPCSPKRKRQWLQYAGVEKIPHGQTAYLCSKHFSDKYVQKSTSRIKLSADAFPDVPVPIDIQRTLFRDVLPVEDDSVKRKRKGYADTEFDIQDGTTSVVQSTLCSGVKEKHPKYEGTDVLNGISGESDEEILRNSVLLQNVCNTSETVDKSFDSKQCQEEIENDNILENVKKQLCRVCGRTRTALLPIFGNHMLNEVPISEKIQMHLPLKIRIDDDLPLNICVSCNSMVQAWHDLHVSCLAADAVLQRMFSEASNIVSDDCQLENSDERWTERCPSKEDYSDLSREECSTMSLHTAKEAPRTKCKEKLIKSKRDSVEGISLLSHSGVQSYSYKTQCLYCSGYFESLELKQHKVQCQVQVTMCEFCGVCVQMRYLKSHVLKVHDKNSLCEMCGKFFSVYNLKKHSGECVLEPTSYCEPCCRLFYSGEGYKMHMKDHTKGAVQHLGIKIKASFQEELSLTYHCPVCEDCFCDKLSVIVHLNSYKVTTCKPCNEDFRNERTFLAHVCIPQKKLWHCRHCFKTFERKYSWQIHERSHGGNKHFSCKMCGKNYPSLESLLQHCLSHGSTSFECSYCEKKFGRQSSLKEHILYHEGFIYKCKLCEKQFRTSYSLRTHRIHVHGKIKARASLRTICKENQLSK